MGLRGKPSIWPGDAPQGTAWGNDRSVNGRFTTRIRVTLRRLGDNGLGGYLTIQSEGVWLTKARVDAEQRRLRAELLARAKLLVEAQGKRCTIAEYLLTLEGAKEV